MQAMNWDGTWEALAEAMNVGEDELFDHISGNIESA
jgi:hypothetical protein